MKRLAVHFARLGPYHLARIHSAAVALRSAGWQVVGLETAGSDTTYAWREEETADIQWKRYTVFPNDALERISAPRLKAGMITALDDLKPEAVVIAGWGSPDARACLAWCRKHAAKAIVMSETREADGVRVWWKEWLKSRIIRRFDGALVGGASQRDYLVKLGIPAERIQLGYNVVDNAFFAAEAEKWRRYRAGTRSLGTEGEDAGGLGAEGSNCLSKANHQPSTPYFLASNRFIERKNLARLVEAYASYLTRASDGHRPTLQSWNLCLLGDGELKADLIARCRSLGLDVVELAPWEHSSTSGSVFFPGFRQIEELPRFYAHAGCFVHPALEEPWGLVLNEAMACGLPVLSGANVGAAEELIDDGVNGWTFDATSVEAMADRLTGIATLGPTQLEDMGLQSLRILAERGPTEAFGKGLAVILRDLDFA